MFHPLWHRVRYVTTLQTLLGEIKTACFSKFAIPRLQLLPALFLVRFYHYYYRTLGRLSFVFLLDI